MLKLRVNRHSPKSTKIQKKKFPTIFSQKLLATAAAAITSPAAVLTETFVVPSTSNAAALPHELNSNGNLAKIKIEKLDEENQAPPSNAGRKNSAGTKSGVKRPSNLGTIGIATVHQHHHRNGLIAAGNNQFLSAMAPANKIPKMESGLAEEYGPNNRQIILDFLKILKLKNRSLLIGIAVSSASSNPFGIPNGFNGMDQSAKGVADSISSVPSNSSFAQQDQLQQMFFKNPDLAYNVIFFQYLYIYIFLSSNNPWPRYTPWTQLWWPKRLLAASPPVFHLRHPNWEVQIRP